VRRAEAFFESPHAASSQCAAVAGSPTLYLRPEAHGRRALDDALDRPDAALSRGRGGVGLGQRTSCTRVGRASTALERLASTNRTEGAMSFRSHTWPSPNAETAPTVTPSRTNLKTHGQAHLQGELVAARLARPAREEMDGDALPCVALDESNVPCVGPQLIGEPDGKTPALFDGLCGLHGTGEGRPPRLSRGGLHFDRHHAQQQATLLLVSPYSGSNCA